jgi:glutamate formiminotransferase/glutamate formiminotransferase/formiminotetrahydrofolate cyclodeaminase
MTEAAGAEILLGVPNFSEGRSERVIRALEATLGAHAEVLDVHADPQHHRSVYTLAAPAPELKEALLAGAAQAIEVIDFRAHQGLHPRIGALDVCPVVYRGEGQREAARAAARELAERLGSELEIPIFLYGELASDEERRERAFFRRGGPAELARRMSSGDLEPDFGPPEVHPTAGATLVTARPPLVAFNLELDTPNPEIARAVAEKLRESGGGLAGVRAIGLPREGERSQVSINVHDPEAVPLARLVEEVERLAAEHDASPCEAELVGLAPEAALADYPDHVPIAGFDPDRHVIESRLKNPPR